MFEQGLSRAILLQSWHSTRVIFLFSGSILESRCVIYCFAVGPFQTCDFVLFSRAIADVPAFYFQSGHSRVTRCWSLGTACSMTQHPRPTGRASLTTHGTTPRWLHALAAGWSSRASPSSSPARSIGSVGRSLSAAPPLTSLMRTVWGR